MVKGPTHVCPLTFAAFPRDPEIQLSGPLEVGKPVTVTCLMRDVYPFERLEMDLLKGDRLLKNQEFLEPAETKSLETKGLEVAFTPTSEDIGEALVCRAQLHINEIDEALRKKETRKILQVHSKCSCDMVEPSREFSLGCAHLDVHSNAFSS